MKPCLLVLVLSSVTYAHATVCGDGIVTADETCDDGGGIFGDGCSASCSVELGWACSGSPSTCFASCGDGVRTGGEMCDDGNRDAGDGCSPSCYFEADSDGDGVSDGPDTDADGDGISDVIESGMRDPDADPDVDDVPAWRDPGTPGFSDADHDGVDDRLDADGDSIPNHLDDDSDGDGVPDHLLPAELGQATADGFGCAHGRPERSPLGSVVLAAAALVFLTRRRAA
jgi:cysteine-rich repeat protein